MCAISRIETTLLHFIHKVNRFYKALILIILNLKIFCEKSVLRQLCCCRALVEYCTYPNWCVHRVLYSFSEIYCSRLYCGETITIDVLNLLFKQLTKPLVYQTVSYTYKLRPLIQKECFGSWEKDF